MILKVYSLYLWLVFEGIVNNDISDLLFFKTLTMSQSLTDQDKKFKAVRTPAKVSCLKRFLR